MKYNVRDEKGRFVKSETLTLGTKAFNNDWTCLDKQYRVGETYEESGGCICRAGMMHFCKEAAATLNYYPPVHAKLKYALVKADGKITEKEDKTGASKLTIVKEITLEDAIQRDFMRAKKEGRVDYALDVPSKNQDVCYVDNVRTACNFSYSTIVCKNTPCLSLSCKTLVGLSCSIMSNSSGNVYSYIRPGIWADIRNLYAFAKENCVVKSDLYGTAISIDGHARAEATNPIAIAVGKHYTSAKVEKNAGVAISLSGPAAGELGSFLVLGHMNYKGDMIDMKVVKVDGRKIKPGVFYRLNMKGEVEKC